MPVRNVRPPSQNESTSAEERQPDRIKEVGVGPDKGPAGEYLPARYPLSPRNKQPEGNVREDR